MIISKTLFLKAATLSLQSPPLTIDKNRDADYITARVIIERRARICASTASPCVTSLENLIYHLLLPHYTFSLPAYSEADYLSATGNGRDGIGAAELTP